MNRKLLTIFPILFCFMLSGFPVQACTAITSTIKDYGTSYRGIIQLADLSPTDDLWVTYYNSNGKQFGKAHYLETKETNSFIFENESPGRVTYFKIMVWDKETFSPKTEANYVYPDSIINAASNVAVIHEVIPHPDHPTFYTVEYYLAGELQTAQINSQPYSPLTTASKGDVFQLAVKDGAIIAAEKIMDYHDTIGSSPTPDMTGAMPFGIDEIGCGTMFGAITNISNKGAITLSGSHGGTISAKDAEQANVYILDPNKRINTQLYIGTAGEAEVDETLCFSTLDASVTRTITGTYKKDKTPIHLTLNGVDELQLFPYAFAYQFEHHVIDIVIYKPFEFSYSYEDSL